MAVFGRNKKAAGELDKAGLPRHIAVILDGNGRWARKRLLPRIAGHRQGVEALRACIRACAARGIEALATAVAQAVCEAP